MQRKLLLPFPAKPILSTFLARLEALYAQIDEAYQAAAVRCGFVCSGCDENCCLTRFHHHTLLEFFHLREGFRQLPMSEQQSAKRRAQTVLKVYEAAKKNEAPPRTMCPLNVEQRCRLYGYRPMICRMHGIPHVLHPAGRPPIYGPGCAAFSESCTNPTAAVFDRTPFYRSMAALEKEMRSAAGFTGKTKMTVAEMILCFCEHEP